MAIQNLGPAQAYVPHQHPSTLARSNGQGGAGMSAAPARNRVAASTEYYSSQKLNLEFTNEDGDRVTLNYEHVEYAKSMITARGSMSDNDWQTLVKKLTDEFAAFQKKIMEKFVEGLGGETGESEEVEGGKEAALGEVPEYWNAENTSQRIVDFATAYFDSFEGNGEEFLDIIKGAVEEGFNQARDILGTLPEPVEELVSETHDLVLEKLDTWAESKGIGEENVEEEVAAA